jgi:aryl-alcohol dehydrogenase-like predicted oxidoreductase
MGLLSSKFLGGKDFLDPDDQRVSIIPLFSDEIFPAAQDAAKRIAAIGEKYGKTLAQTAVNWVAYRPGITTAMVGAKTAAEITEDIGGIGWQLSPEDRKAIGDIGMEIASTVSDWDTLFQKDHPMLKVTW